MQRFRITPFTKILYVILFIFTLCLTLSRNVFASPFNVVVHDDDPDQTERWTPPGICSPPHGITLQCVNNCGSLVWACDAAGGHLDVESAVNGAQIDIRLVEPLPNPFNNCSWFVIDRGPNLTGSTVVAQGTGCTTSFTMQYIEFYRYGVFFTMTTPPPATPTPTATPTPAATPTPLPTATPTSDIFVGGGNCEEPPGCFDCQWRAVGGGSICMADDGSNCTSGFFADNDHCFELNKARDPAGTCLAYEHQDLPCVGPSGGDCTGASSDQPGICHTTDFCPGGTVMDGTCSFGGRCCVPPFSAEAGAFLCDSGEGIDTAIGCIIYTNMTPFTRLMILWFMGIGGGASFLIMIYAAFLIITSAGDPYKLAQGKTILTSALSGLLFIIFSVFLLRTIGVDILRILEL